MLVRIDTHTKKFQMKLTKIRLLILKNLPTIVIVKLL